MAEKRVMFVMSNAPEQDVRVFKEARALKQAGYVTSLLYTSILGQGGKE